MQFQDKLFDLFRAGYPVLMLQTYEYQRAYALLKRYCREHDSLLFQWNCTDGLGEMGLSYDSVLGVGDRVAGAEQVLEEIERRLDSRENEMFVLEGLGDYMHLPDVKVYLRNLALDIPKSEGRKHVILLGPDHGVPLELARFVAVVDMPYPDFDELATILDTAVKSSGADVEEGLRRELVKAASGLTAHEAALAFRLAGVRDGFGHRALESVREAFLLQPKGEGQ